jgi:tetratricopeptide (TPR) repeat protein
MVLIMIRSGTIAILGAILLGGSGCRTVHLAAADRTALAHSYLERAARLARSGQTDRALAAADMAVRFDPEYRPVRLFRGELRFAAGRIEGALEDYETAVRLTVAKGGSAEERALARAGRAACFQALGRSADAVADYEEALRLVPDLPEWRLELGKALMGIQRYAEAESAFTALVDLDPPPAGVFAWRAEARFAQGRYEEAARDYVEALKERPTEGDLWRRLGLALLEAGLEAEAQEALEKAATLEPKDPAVWTALGMACEARGDDAGAFRAYRRALAISPHYLPARQGEQRLVQRAQNEVNP